MSIADFKRVLVQNATDPNVVDQVTADEQLASAAALRSRLNDHGGVILGDEVGAGKTFVTFAVLTEALLRQPERGAVIFVPSDPLTRKWARQLREYLRAAVIDTAAGEALARRVVGMSRSLYVSGEGGGERRPRRGDIIVTQHSVFSRQTSEWDRVRCVDEWLSRRYASVTGGTRAPRQRFFAACGLDRAKVDDEWATWAWNDVLTKSTLAPLDRVWSLYDGGRRDLRGPMREAVLDVRREVGRRVLRDLALVVVDEAHNLRSTSSQVYRSLMYVLHEQFDSMLFLTATPFQLGRDELRSVVEFFRSARPAQAQQEAFDLRVGRMEAGMDSYMRALSDFGRAWADLDESGAHEVEDAAATCAPETMSTEAARRALVAYREALVAKDHLEDGLRPFLVRTVRVRHHRERAGVDEIGPESRLPIALVDRVISERLAASNRTFVASALTSACSSWEALFAASITNDAVTSPALAALHALRARGLLGLHPKVDCTVRRCSEASQHGEKTLVFVERTETGRLLRDQLEGALGKGLDRTAYARLQDPRRFGWPSLRENYLHTLYPQVFGAIDDAPRTVTETVRSPGAVSLWRRIDTEGAINYKVAKRFIEHVVFRAAAERTPRWDRDVDAPLRRSIENLLEEDYIANGLDLMTGETQQRIQISTEPTRVHERELREEFVSAFAAYASPWVSSTRWLDQLSPEARAELVDAAADAIASSHLQAEVEQQDVEGDPAAYFRQTQELLSAPAGLWRARFEAIAQMAADRAAGGGDHADDRVAGLAAALRQAKRVIFVSGETDNTTKQRAIDGFNAPLYPEIVIATGVFAEGIDLHRSCRRVIHHDLPWNPAKLEQRTGRVDRIGSLSSRLQSDLGDVDESAVDIGLPYVSGTYDETIFRRVLARRREFRCLLGNKPEWDREDLVDGEILPLGESLVTGLQVALGP